MALDKQSILNELGSVMNKLQSADCGCMGKLFGNQSGGESGAPMGNPNGGCGGFGGCRGGCCHHGHGGHCGFNFGHGGGRFNASGGGEPCMGSCNPRKMYSETYNYLNNNLMQPVVNEVYNDLKSLTPENTVANNSAMAAKMGLSPHGNMQGGNLMQGNNGMQDSNPMSGGNPMLGGNPMQGGNNMYGGNQMQGGHTMQGGNNLDVNYMQGGNTYNDRIAVQGMTPAQNQMQPGMTGDPMQNNASRPQNQMYGNGFVGDMTNQKVQQMMGGMGPGIMEMMKSGGKSKSPSGQMPSSQMPSGQMPNGQMIIDAPQSPHGQVGVTSLNPSGGMYYNAESGLSNNSNQHMFNQPTTQYVSGATMNVSGFNANQQNYSAMNGSTRQRQSNQMQQGLSSPNMESGVANPDMNQTMAYPNMHQGQSNLNMQQNVTNANAQNGLIYSNASAKQTDQPGNRNYGMHNQGMQKFNEMFPGVIGKDLGFDPMAIAIQMNPQNHQRAAMDTMNKMMNGKLGNVDKAMDGANAAVKALASQNVLPTNQGNVSPAEQQALGRQPDSALPIDQQYDSTSATPVQQIPQHQQQTYYATTPNQATYNVSQVSNQGHVPPQQQYQYQQKQVLDPTTGAPNQQNMHQGGAEQTNSQIQEQVSEPITEAQMMIQDPIFPADTSRPFNAPLSMRRQKFYQYNTLGQPVELLPAKMFHSAPETNFQQTLYPQSPSGKLRKGLSKLNVKSTVSKTSIMGNKPDGTPSRSNLQNIYHQYKGSHSSTLQNVRNPAYQSDTHSEGKIGGAQRVNVAPTQAHVEKVGGDTTANNQAARTLAPVKEAVQEHGDIAGANKPPGEHTVVKELPKLMGNSRKNGLQDQVYTSYQTSAAWSFHGEGAMPYSGYRRYRPRA